MLLLLLTADEEVLIQITRVDLIYRIHFLLWCGFLSLVRMRGTGEDLLGEFF